ncbi:MAG: LysM peptidoglycan-binding domain-containing protein [Sphingobacteriales bacterium]|nr:LysM peptidoglycan-binding domain-containing protein [Sphingobacteriales bacterium]
MGYQIPYRQKGDTISEIADHHNVSIQKICSLNKISVKTTLKPGRKLRVK